MRRPGYERGDWQINPYIFKQISDVWVKDCRKPFQVDCGSDSMGYNSMCNVYCSNDDKFEHRIDVAGKSLWSNPDYRKVKTTIEHFLFLKDVDPSTEMCMVVPHDSNRDWYPLLKEHFTLSHVYNKHWRAPAGCKYAKLFSRPVVPGSKHREEPGDPPFNVSVWFSKKPKHHSTRTVQVQSTDIPTVVAAYHEPSESTTRQFMRSGVSDLLVFQSTLNNEKMSLLMDTGAQVNLISETVVRSLNLAVKPVNVSIGWLYNTTLPVKKLVPEVTVTIEGEDVVLTNLLVTPLMNYDIVMGMHGLRCCSCKVDCEDRSVSVTNSKGKIVRIKSKRLIPTTYANHSKVDFGYCSYVQAKQIVKAGGHMLSVYVHSTMSADDGDVDHGEETMYQTFVKQVQVGVVQDELSMRIMPDCPQPYRQQILQLLIKYKSFFDPPTALPKPSEFDLELKLKPGAKAVKTNPYRLSDAERAELEKRIQAMLEMGWIKACNSDWASPIMFVVKPDKSLRLVLDYRALNQATEGVAAPVPMIETLLDSIRGSSVFTKVDLQSGFHQMLIKESSQRFTSFSCELGQFCWQVLPQGLKQSPSVFSSFMASRFGDFISRRELALYIDDLLFHSKSWADHVVLLDKALKRFCDFGLKGSLKKCIFGTQKCTFLGHEVTPQGVTPSVEKKECIESWPTPETAAHLHSFIGLVGWFRKYVPRFTERIYVLQQLLTDTLRDGNKLSKLDWTPTHQAAFEDMKKALVDPTVMLPHFSPERPTTVWVDASQFGIGAVLLQFVSDKNVIGGWHPIAFMSRRLKVNELGWDVRDKELLAAVEACKMWRHWLMSVKQPFTLVTDHKSLQSYAATRTQHARLTRMLMKLNSFDFTPVYRRGENNVVADLLSRRSDYSKWFEHFKQELELPRRHMLTQTISHVQVRVGKVKVSKKVRFADECCGHRYVTTPGYEPRMSHVWSMHVCPSTFLDDVMVEKLRDDAKCVSVEQRKLMGLHEHDELLYTHGGKLYVHDPVMRKDVIVLVHNKFHQGSKATYKRLSKVVYFPYMYKLVVKVCKGCEICAKSKSVRGKPSHTILKPTFRPDNPHKPQGPFSHMCIDFVWGLNPIQGHTGFMTMLDPFSKFVIAQEVKPTLTGAQAVDIIMRRWFPYFGPPKAIVSDNDVRFLGSVWKEMVERFKAIHFKSSVYYPRANGAVERCQDTICSLLRAGELQGKDWRSQLPLVLYALNSTPHSSTSLSPYQVLFGMDLPLSYDNCVDDELRRSDVVNYRELARKELEKHAVMMKDQEGGFDPSSWLQVGKKVYLKTAKLKLKAHRGSKLLPKYIGPFVITKVVGTTAHLQLPSHFTVSKIWNASYLKPFMDDGFGVVDTLPFGYSLNELYESEEEGIVPEMEKVIVELKWIEKKQSENYFRARYQGETWRSSDVLKESELCDLGYQDLLVKARQQVGEQHGVDLHLDTFEDD